MSPEWPVKVTRSLPVRTSHTRTVLSFDPVATKRQLGEKATK